MHKQKCFSVIIKNLNLEILTKNLVTFKKWNGVKGELWGFIENSVNFFRGAHEKPICRRGKGRGGGEKGEAGRGKGGGGEGRGVDNGMHTMLSPTISLLFCY